MRTSLAAFGALWLLLLALSLAAQQSTSSAATPQLPYVEFQFEWNQGLPWVRYTITVDQMGKTHFQGVGNAAESGDGDAFSQDFQMTEANRQKVFDLAKEANYFEGDFEAKQKNIAKTGKKTLEYHGYGKQNSTTYNYSPNPNIQQLTKLFQSIATTLDFGRKLAFQYRFDKLGMDSRLQSLADNRQEGYVEELQAIEPILRQIANDPNMMHISRQEAKQLLKTLSSSISPQPATAQP